MTATASVPPVGTIVAYAGAWDSSYEINGWMLCDGRQLSSVQFQELYNAIGIAFGGNSSTSTFCLPQLQGYFLRGVTGTSKSNPDPDVASRTALQTGGNTGNNAGSFQTYGTAPPTNKFTMNYQTAGSSASDKETGSNSANSSDGSSNTVTVTGGDIETRPVNKYVYFLIKYATFTGSQQYVVTPVGAVVPFAGVNAAQTIGGTTSGYVLCNGNSITTSQYPQLAAAIGFAHGQDSSGNPILPDYRGYFLRSVTGKTANDPSASARTAPYAASGAKSPGNSGNNVGSVQSYATANGVKAPLSATVPKQVLSGDQKRGKAYSQTIVSWNASNSTLKATGGGDAESRPLNMAVDWYIKYQ